VSTRVDVPLSESAGGGATGAWLDGDGDDLLLLAHGAGSHAEHPTIAALAAAFAEVGFTVARFDFAYRRPGPDGERPRRPPDRLPRLVACYRAVARDLAARLAPARLFAGGHSLGSRAAAHAATDGEPHERLRTTGLVLCAFPLHPPKRPERRRDAVLHAAVAERVPTLVVSGTRDPFFTAAVADEVLASLGDGVTCLRPESADHGYAVPRRSGRTRAAVLAELAGAARAWAQRLA